jgi:hypothetical protein
MQSNRVSKKGLQDELEERAGSKSTKRAKKATTSRVSKQDQKAREQIANNEKRTRRRHVQRKSRVQPLTKSSGRGRGNAKTRKRKEAAG